MGPTATERPPATSAETGDPCAQHPPAEERRPWPTPRQPPGLTDVPAPVRVRRHRHGAVRVRRPAVPAAGTRSQRVRRDGRRRRHGGGRPARRARRHPRPQRRAAGHLGRRRHDRGRPVDDGRPGTGAGKVPRLPARGRLLHDPAAAPRGGQPVPVHRAPGALDRGRRRHRRRPRRPASTGSTPGTTRSVPTPPATSRRTWSASWAPTRRSVVSNGPSRPSSPAPTARPGTQSAVATGSRSVRTRSSSR